MCPAFEPAHSLSIMFDSAGNSLRIWRQLLVADQRQVPLSVTQQLRLEAIEQLPDQTDRLLHLDLRREVELRHVAVHWLALREEVLPLGRGNDRRVPHERFEQTIHPAL